MRLLFLTFVLSFTATNIAVADHHNQDKSVEAFVIVDSEEETDAISDTETAADNDENKAPTEVDSDTIETEMPEVDTAAEEDMTVTTDQCWNDYYNYRGKLHCLNSLLDDEKEKLSSANEFILKQANEIQAPKERRQAVQNFTASNLAFGNYMNAECKRQRDAHWERTEAQYTFLACQIELIQSRLNQIQAP